MIDLQDKSVCPTLGEIGGELQETLREAPRTLSSKMNSMGAPDAPTSPAPSPFNLGGAPTSPMPDIMPGPNDQNIPF